MSAAWAQVPLGEVVEHRKEFINIDDIQMYRRPRVQLHAKGIVLRDAVPGALIKTKKQQVVRAGEFLVAEIDAKVGGFGIVPNELDGAIVSSHYFLYGHRPDRLDNKYLGWFVKTRAFREQVEAQGSTNYAAIRPADVLGYKIPLPPLDEQRRIVARIEELAAKVYEARELRRSTSEEAAALQSAAQQGILAKHHTILALNEACLVIDPNPSHRYPLYVDSGVPMITSSNFSGVDDIVLSNTKRVTDSFFQETLGRFGIGQGDVIFARKGKVGYARPYPAGINLAMTHTLCVLKPDRSQLDPRYLLHFARSAGFLAYLNGTMNPNLGVPTLGLNVIREAPLPLPPLDEQCRIATQLDDLQAKVDVVKALQNETATELEAMLPAILDKAFKGEL